MSNQKSPKGHKSTTKDLKKEVNDIKKGVATVRQTLDKKKGK